MVGRMADKYTDGRRSAVADNFLRLFMSKLFPLFVNE